MLSHTLSSLASARSHPQCGLSCLHADISVSYKPFFAKIGKFAKFALTKIQRKKLPNVQIKEKQADALRSHG